MALTELNAGDGARIHALIIGIGGYDHLKGGTGIRLPDLLKYGNLGQLTSPPRSAVAMAKALQAPALDWQVPLGTVELLVSTAPEDPDPAGDGTQFEPATRDAIQDAFERWWDRCDSDQENVAFFYVAGHGLEGLHHVVLASDFGKSRKRPWRHAFDVGDTRRGLTANKAQTQIFLVDACREVTTSNVEAPDAHPDPLCTPEMRQRDNCNYALTIMATSHNQKAYGPVKKPSYFAQAFIKGLTGGAAVKGDGTWWITTGKLSERFYTLMDLVGADINVQRPSPTAPRTFRLAQLRTAPPATLELSCHPGEATRVADLACRQGAEPLRYRPKRAPEPWKIPVEPGEYFVSASFTGGEYKDNNQQCIVEPPLTSERVIVI